VETSTGKLNDQVLENLQFRLDHPDRVAFSSSPCRLAREIPEISATARALRYGHACVYLNPQLGCEYPAPYLFDPHPRSARCGWVLELHVHLPGNTNLTNGRGASEIRRVVRAVEDVAHAANSECRSDRELSALARSVGIHQSAPWFP